MGIKKSDELVIDMKSGFTFPPTGKGRILFGNNDPKIEKDVPMPKMAFYDSLNQMEVNESFVFLQKNYSNLRSCLLLIKMDAPSKKFKTKRISKTERRIWRKI